MIQSVASFVPRSSIAAPQTLSASAPQQKDSFVKAYADNVKANFEKDGVGWTLLASGGHGFVGGLLGGIGGALVGSVLPGPIGPFVANACEIAGAAGGFLYRLGRKPDA